MYQYLFRTTREEVAQVLFGHRANIPVELLSALRCFDLAMCQDVEERWVTLVFDRHRYADLLRRSDLNERLSALVKLVQPLCKNEVTACGTPEGTTISGVTLSPQLLRDLHQVGIQVIPLVK